MHAAARTLTRGAFALLAAACAPAAPQPETKRKLEMIEAPASVTDVAALVRTELAAAGAAHNQLVVYVGASWCEPCRRFHDAAAAGQLDDSFGQVRFLSFDLDRDVDALQRAGYKSELIPLFTLPSADGTSSGRQIEGSVKGDSAVAEITPRLRELLR